MISRIRSIKRVISAAAGVAATLFMLTAGAAASDKNLLRAVVGIETTISPDARTARILGTQRQGSGVVIDDEGLVLTIGYLMLEADGAVITGPSGKAVPATVVAYDSETGLGLLRLMQKLNVVPLRLGDSSQLKKRDQVIIASRGGPQPLSAAQVVSRRIFSGYWEYLLERAIFTSPPHGFHSGAALIGRDGRLLGIGSLLVNDAVAPNVPSPGNMFVPVNDLKPALADLLQSGRRSGRKRPWIGANTVEANGRLFVTRVTPNGPADAAGIKTGDLILGLGGYPIESQPDFYRRLWRSGEPGSEIDVNILSKGANDLKIRKVTIKSEDRYNWLKITRSY